MEEEKIELNIDLVYKKHADKIAEICNGMYKKLSTIISEIYDDEESSSCAYLGVSLFMVLLMNNFNIEKKKEFLSHLNDITLNFINEGVEECIQTDKEIK